MLLSIFHDIFHPFLSRNAPLDHLDGFKKDDQNQGIRSRCFLTSYNTDSALSSVPSNGSFLLDMNATVSQSEVPTSFISQTGTELIAIDGGTTGGHQLISTILENKKFSLSFALKDRMVYLKRHVPVQIQGVLILKVKKTTQFKQIKIVLEGISFTSLLMNATMQYRLKKHQFLSEERTWNFPAGSNRDSPHNLVVSGSYNLPFTFKINHSQPESIESPLGSVMYRLKVDATTQRRYYRKRLTARQPLRFIQADLTPDTNNFISTANWRSFFYYEVLIYGTKPLAIGGTADITVKIVPIVRGKYKIRAITVSMVQILSSGQKGKFSHVKYTENTQVEKIPMVTVNIRDLQDPNVLKPYIKHLHVTLRQTYLRHSDDESFSIYPSTSKTVAETCDFRIKHELNVGIIVQEVESTDESVVPSIISKDNQSIDKYPRIDDEQSFIQASAKIIDENIPVAQRLQPVELIIKQPVQVCTQESMDANIAPPAYGNYGNDTGINYGERTSTSMSIPPAYEETNL